MMIIIIIIRYVSKAAQHHDTPSAVAPCKQMAALLYRQYAQMYFRTFYDSEVLPRWHRLASVLSGRLVIIPVSRNLLPQLIPQLLIYSAAPLSQPLDVLQHNALSKALLQHSNDVNLRCRHEPYC